VKLFVITSIFFDTAEQNAMAKTNRYRFIMILKPISPHFVLLNYLSRYLTLCTIFLDNIVSMVLCSNGRYRLYNTEFIFIDLHTFQ